MRIHLLPSLAQDTRPPVKVRGMTNILSLRTERATHSVMHGKEVSDGWGDEPMEAERE